MPNSRTNAAAGKKKPPQVPADSLFQFQMNYEKYRTNVQGTLQDFLKKRYGFRPAALANIARHVGSYFKENDLLGGAIFDDSQSKTIYEFVSSEYTEEVVHRDWSPPAIQDFKKDEAVDYGSPSWKNVNKN